MRDSFISLGSQVLLTAGSLGTKNWRDRSARHGPLHDKYRLWLLIVLCPGRSYTTCHDSPWPRKWLREDSGLQSTRRGCDSRRGCSQHPRIPCESQNATYHTRIRVCDLHIISMSFLIPFQASHAPRCCTPSSICASLDLGTCSLVKQLWLCFPSISCSPRCWWKEQCLTGKWNGSKSTLFLTSTASTSLYGRKPSPVLSLIFLRTSTHLVYCRSALQMKSSRQTALLTVSKESDWKGHLSELCCFAISLWVA